MNFNSNIISFAIGLVVMCLIMLKCNDCPEIQKTVTTVDRVITTDTIIDSTYVKMYNELIGMIPEEVNLPNNNSFNQPNEEINSNTSEDTLNPLRRFITKVDDKTENHHLTGEIINMSFGKVVSTDFKYEIKSLLETKTITIHDSVTVTNDNYIKKNNILIGLETSIKPSIMQLSAKVDFLHKKGWAFGYRYERNFNDLIKYKESHNISVSKTIF